MRVIAGCARRLNLVTPKGNDTRPTSDKIKETLFNILAPELFDVSFLDIFAGSGAIGIEALSRGAKNCTFIEKDKAALACIRKNLETTHFTEVSEVCSQDAIAALYNLGPKRHYDIVFMDPPYNLGLERSVLSHLAGSAIIDEDSLIIVEADINTDMSYAPDLGFDIIRVKNYKNNKHVFLRRQDRKKEEVS